MAAFESNDKLPEGWYYLDEGMAIRAYIEGCKRWGAAWFEDGDGTSYDVVIQLALLGEIRYG